jgi:hypothetical protein
MQNVDLLPIGPYPAYPRYIRIKTLGRNCSQSIQNATLKGKVLAALDLGLLAPFRGRVFAYFAFQNFQRTALVWNGFLAGSGDGHTLTLARTKRYGEEKSIAPTSLWLKVPSRISCTVSSAMVRCSRLKNAMASCSASAVSRRVVG